MTNKLFAGKGKELDMTQGGIVQNILRFAIPLLLGNLFQQFYNMVDTWVIGQTGVNSDYAAVGSVGPIINILIGFFTGLASGTGVIISQYYGAKKYDKIKKTVHSAMILTGILSVVFTVIGLGMTPQLLEVIYKTKTNGTEVFQSGKTYLTIYFSGVTALLIYNMGAGILRAIGDSTRPFIFLVASAVTNILLDLLFVFEFHWGVAGVALATVIAQIVSAVLTLFVLLTSDTCVKVKWSDMKWDSETVDKIFQVGLPAGLQMALTAFSNVFVQSYIANVNGNQTYCLGGWTSYSKVDQIIFLPISSLALAVTTFVGQNLGVGDVKRAKKGTMITFLMALGATVVGIVAVVVFASPIAAFFNADRNVVEMATMFLRFLTPFYLLCCINQVFSGSLRGAGNTKAPMIMMLVSFVGVRQLYLWVMSTFISNDPLPIGLAYPVGWFACAVMTLIYYTRFRFERSRILDRKETKKGAEID